MTINQFQEDMLAAGHVHAHIRFALHGNVLDFEPLQVQVLRLNEDTRSVPYVVRTVGNRHLAEVNDRLFARVREVMNALVVT